jgi:hypothetical protein
LQGIIFAEQTSLTPFLKSGRSGHGKMKNLPY